MAALFENVLTVNMLLGIFFLPGVVATTHLRISALKEMETLSGSCLHIPCTFEAINGVVSFDNSIEIVGIWYKNDHSNLKNVIFDSSKSVNVYPMNITGILKKNDCTTLFSDLNTSHQGAYYFRIVNGEFKATAYCDPIQIKVKDSAWKPNIAIDLTNLKEHQSVTVTCSAFTPCPHSPPELTWNLQQDSLREIEKNTDGTFTTKIQENITLSDTHDGYNIRCSARYPVIGGIKTAETKVTLNVSYAPRNTSASISPSGLVSAGSRVELSCSSRAKPPPSFTWFWKCEHGTINVSVGPVYSFNATEGGEYSCAATNDLGQTRSSVILVTNKGSGLGVYTIIKILGSLMLCGTIIIFECWFRFSKRLKKDTEEANVANRVMEVQEL